MSAHLIYFINTLFVALFDRRDVGHILSDSSWVNVMHEELEREYMSMIGSLLYLTVT
jgi:GTP1/Obg family GTP-binding protein